MPEFVPGLRLGEQFYREAVRPVLDAEFPDLPHSAALIGSGSEVPVTVSLAKRPWRRSPIRKPMSQSSSAERPRHLL